jgi:hypothetical protein
MLLDKAQHALPEWARFADYFYCIFTYLCETTTHRKLSLVEKANNSLQK